MKLSRKIVICSIALIFIWAFFIQVQPVRASSQRVEFNIDSLYDYAGRSKVIAFNSHANNKALFYLEQEWWNALPNQEKVAISAILNDLLSEFSQRIYPVMTTIYGSEWSPGIDNDPRLTVLFIRLKEGVGGYFNTNDEFAKSKRAWSNEREMVYLNLNYIYDKRLKSFLAHEFQHLISFYQKEKFRGLKEDIWLNEGRSEYAPTLLGYDQDFSGSNLQKRVSDFLKKPSDSLSEWRNQKYDYGVINLFMQYVVDHYGTALLTKMMKNNKVGIESFNAALTSLGYQENFFDVFTNWTVANFLNDCSVEPINTYCYLSPNLKNFRVSLNLLGSGASFETGFMVKDWAGYWYQADALASPLVLEIDFFSDSPTANFKIPYIIVKKDGQRQVDFMNLVSKEPGQQGTAYIDDFGGAVVSVVTALSNQYKLRKFTSHEPRTPFYLAFNLNKQIPPSGGTSSYADGSLVRIKGEYKVYVINGKYKRWIQSAAIFNSYGHLHWKDIIEVSAEELDYYQEVWLIRALNDYKVYEINSDGTKHWLNMSPEEFVKSGRKWEMISIVNQFERNWYRRGASIIFNFQ